MHAQPRAKVNLALAVGRRGRDGYHPLRSVFLRVGLADELIVAPAAEGADTLTVTGLPGCPVEGNLVLRAFDLVRRATGHDLPPLVAHLDKRIPMGAGLGGGSSDGAAAVDAALAVWRVGLAPEVLADIALALGADVPFFGRGGPVALVEGRGELVTPLPPVAGAPGLLLITSRGPQSTAAVFDRFDELATGGSIAAGMTEALAQAISAGISGDQLVDWASRLRDANELWPAAAALAPELDDRRHQLEAATGQPWLLSGSGSTLFAVYPSVESASRAGRSLAASASVDLAQTVIHAVDLVGPQPAWSQSWS
jgi:4-diphosphocytidyl-2-C-methyl-D-erythritol kinase